MNEDQVERFLRKTVSDATREFGRVEISERRRTSCRQSRDHTRRLNRVTDGDHFEVSSMRCESPTFLRFYVGAHQRRDGDGMRTIEVPDHVERPDLASSLGWKGKAMTDVKNLHANATFNSSTMSVGDSESR